MCAKDIIDRVNIFFLWLIPKFFLGDFPIFLGKKISKTQRKISKLVCNG